MHKKNVFHKVRTLKQTKSVLFKTCFEQYFQCCSRVGVGVGVGMGGYTHVILYILSFFSYALCSKIYIVLMIVNKQSIALIHIIYSDCIGVPLCESSIHRYIFSIIVQ